MKLRSLRTESKPKLMIIPMIDIIFFLLVFFMMSMLSMVVQKSIPVTLPVSASAKVDLERKIPVTITSQGKLYVEDKEVNLDQFIRLMQAEQAKGDNLIVIMRADTTSQYGVFVTVLDTLKKIGISNVSIATDGK